MSFPWKQGDPVSARRLEEMRLGSLQRTRGFSGYSTSSPAGTLTNRGGIVQRFVPTYDATAAAFHLGPGFVYYWNAANLQWQGFCSFDHTVTGHTSIIDESPGISDTWIYLYAEFNNITGNCAVYFEGSPTHPKDNSVYEDGLHTWRLLGKTDGTYLTEVYPQTDWYIDRVS